MQSDDLLLPATPDEHDFSDGMECIRSVHGALPEVIWSEYAAATPAAAPPEITVACLVFRDSDYDQHLRRALAHQDLGFELLLERNGDNHITLARFYNHVLEVAAHDRILFCHPDIEFSPWGLRRLVDTFAAHDDCGAAGFVGVTIQGRFLWAGSRRRHGVVSTLDGCALMVDRRHRLRFDEDTFDGFHCVVEDYCLQVQQHGRRVYVAAPVSVAHWGGTALMQPAATAEAWLEDFHRYYRRFEAKWCGIPYCTTAGGPDWRTRQLRETVGTLANEVADLRGRLLQQKQVLESEAADLRGRLLQQKQVLENEVAALRGRLAEPPRTWRPYARRFRKALTSPARMVWRWWQSRRAG